MWRKLQPLRRFSLALWLLPLIALPGWTKEIKWNDHRAERLGPKQALRTAPVSERERAAIARTIETQLGPDTALLNTPPNENLKENLLDSPVGLIDLNGDGEREVMVQGPGGGSRSCSPTGNCPFWVLQKTRDGYRLILEGMAQTFRIERSRTNGWRDIVLSMHGSATSSSLTVFRFAETRYVEVACYARDWQVLEGETVRQLTKPRMTPCRQ